ncbi:MAG: hypothetical protein IAE78_12710 [Myxococcus sp.]|nr:hypothetical protein [Myxococcus sp.]
MALAQGDLLLDGWFVERLLPDGAVRFSRAPSVDRRRALSRLVVMGGCLAVTLALLGVSARDADNLWVLTWTVIVLFGLTAGVAGLAAVRDLRLAALGVFLEVDPPAGVVRGVLAGEGVLGQFSVSRVEVPRASVAFTLVAFDERKDGSGMLVVKRASGGQLLAPDLPSLDEVRPLLARLSAA